MIDINLVKQAKSIRSKHIDTINQYNALLGELDKYKKELLSYQDKISKIDVNEETQQNVNEVLNIMDEFDITIEKLNKKIQPLIKDMENLDNNAKLLYNKIKENHPNKTDEELKAQLFKQISELN